MSAACGSEKDLWSEQISKIAKRFLRFARSSLAFWRRSRRIRTRIHVKLKQVIMKKNDLPTKICPVCQRPFVWRKKWERCWDEVKFCSNRCRCQKSKAEKPTQNPKLKTP
jgi:hypothetical protein